MPNWLIEEWSPRQLEQTSNNYNLAMFLPYERENVEKQAADFFGGGIGNKTVADIKKSMQQKEMVLRYSEHEFLIDDIRILHDVALEAVQILKGTVAGPTYKASLVSNTNNQDSKKERNGDLHDLLKRIIIEKPSYSAKKIWAAIEQDFSIDEGEREFYWFREVTYTDKNFTSGY